MNYSALWRGVLLLLSLCVLGYVLHVLHINRILNLAWMDHWVRGKGIPGELLFVGAGALVTAVGVPRQLIAFFAGYSFGVTAGLLLALLATVLGAAACFWYARLFGRVPVRRLFQRQIRHLDHFTHDQPLFKTMAIRLLPVGSNLVTNLVAGVSTIAALPFLLGSALGYIPQTLIFSLAGTGVKVDPVMRLGVSVALLLLFSILAIYWFRHLQADAQADLASLENRAVSAAIHDD